MKTLLKKSILVSIIASLLGILLSCEVTKEDEETGVSFGSSLKEKRKLTTQESAIASDICRALEDKRLFFEQQNRLQANFQTSETQCGGNRFGNTQNVSANLVVPTRGEMHYTPQQGSSLLTDIMTDEQGVLKEVCQNLFSGNQPSNTLDLGDLKYQFFFKKIDGYDSFEVARYRKNGEGNFVPNLIEGYKIYSAFTAPNSDLRGIVLERQRAIACDGGRQYVFRQVFQSLN